MKRLFDITVSKVPEADEMLRVIEKDLIKTLDACEFGIVVFDMDGSCVCVNKRWQSLYQIDASVILQYNMLEDTNLQQKHIWEPIQRSFKGEPGIVEDNYFSPEEWNTPGRGRWTRGHALPIFTNQGSAEIQIGQALLLQDVTDLKVTAHEVRRLTEHLGQIKLLQQDLYERLSTLQEIERRLAASRPQYMPTVHQLREKAPYIPRRENEIFEKLAAGHSVKEAAHILELGIKSVYTYRARLLKRLKLTSDVELAIAWRELHDQTDDQSLVTRTEK